MKTPSTLTLTVNAKSPARLDAKTCPEIGLQMLFLDHEGVVARLAREVHVGNVFHSPEKPKHCRELHFSIRYIGKCAHGRLVEIRTMYSGQKVQAYGCLIDTLGNVSPLSYIEEAFNAESIAAVRYDKTGEIASINLPIQAALTKKCSSWLAKLVRGYDLKPLPSREYRTDWHDNGPATLQVKEQPAKVIRHPATTRKAG